MSNQHINNKDGDILFSSPAGRPLTTLEQWGKRLVLHTNDLDLYDRFREWKQLIYWQGYYQGIPHGPLVAADLFFPLSAHKQLIKSLNGSKPADLKKRGVSQA